MQKLKVLLLILCLALVTGCSQDEPKAVEVKVEKYTGWQEVQVDTTAHFQIPMSLEVQSDNYRKQLEAAVKDKPAELLAMQKQNLQHSKNGNVLCQEAGRNAHGMVQGEEVPYARVSFTTLQIKEQLPEYGKPIGLEAKAIAEYGAITQQSITERETKAHPAVQFSDWSAMQAEIINGVECLHIAYTETTPELGAVRYDLYTFFNKDRLHQLTVASRVSEKAEWHIEGQDLGKIVNTLKITKR